MYENFASVYDRLMSDADYEKRTEYIISLFEEYDKKPTLLLDLCCGTGTFSCAFSKRGISVIGADVSEDMLSEAKEKAEKENEDILFLCQNATELDLYGTVDGAVCLMDSLNHITDYEDFENAIKKVSLFLEKDRLFIFDLNTEYKAKNILGENSFISEENGVFLAWQNEYDKGNLENNIYLDFFVEKENGDYERISETVTEKVYTEEQVKNALEESGLSLVAILDDMKKTPPADKSQRVFYITRKI